MSRRKSAANFGLKEREEYMSEVQAGEYAAGCSTGMPPNDCDDMEPSAEKVDGGHLLTDCGGFVQFVPDQTSEPNPGDILGFGMEDDDEDTNK